MTASFHKKSRRPMGQRLQVWGEENINGRTSPVDEKAFRRKMG
jgi:hypothetical protein